MLKELEKEQKGLYNVVYNGKNASLIKQDLASVENAIALMQGTRYKGAKHERIKHLTDPSKEGYVTDLEFVSLGKSIREYLKDYEPFIDTNGARLYEWEKEGVRFRVVVNDIADMDSNPTTATEEIITFYSDRNLKEAMDFKNPVLKVQEKFKFNPQKAKDLLEWYKDSSPLTKDENGLPKVFYHYTNNGRVLEKKRDNDFEVFTRKTDLKEQYEKIRPYDTHQGRNKGSRYGIYFTENEKYAQKYATLGGQETDLKRALESGNAKKYEVFLNIKNPLDLDTIITEQNAKEIKQLFAIKNPPKHIKAININDYIGKDIFTYIYDLGFNEYEYKSTIAKAVLYRKDKLGVNGERDILNLADFLSLKGYDGVFFSRKETGREFIVFNSNQIKHIDNKGSYTDTSGKISKDKPKDSEAEHKYFNEKSENIYYSNPHIGAGLVGGTLNGVEQDEEGNLSFDPAKFAMGFLGGSLGSKAVSKGIEWRANKVKKAYPNIAKDNPALMEQIAKRDLLTYAKNESANALTRFLNKNKLFDSTRGLFAGEKALLNEAYAPHKARLKEAKALESNGADEIEIWEKTGWYKDKDKKWKFEISQRGGEFDFSGLEFYTFSRDNRVKLSRILKDDELFTAYPSLKNLIVNFDYGIMNDYNLGSYAKDTKEITLNAKKLRDDESRLSTLYHEIQHAIQDIEGFGFGYKEAENLRGISQESVERYAKQHGEVEARNVQGRLDNAYIGEIYSKQSLKDEIQDIKDTILIAQDDPEIAQGLGEMLEKYEKKYQNLEEHDIYNTRRHPYQTMDTPLSETIAESTIQGEALSKELENYNPLAQVKEKVVRKISNYTKLRIFKSLSKDKQDAILSLKDIKPQPMPNTIAKENLENLFKHFENKQDKNARVYYSKLFSDTKKKPHLILETKGKQGQNRKEYVKVYQHKATHDLYYIVVTENNDKINITAHPITEIKELIRHIRNSERASVIKDSNQAPT
ncbi:hypothetical protein CUP1440 [Campylobacter upsaliensis RM3195]|nr:hypothetical protein CUP1440 [Campylobacter upsaliensis RM3195]